MRVLMTTDTIGGVWTFTKELAIGQLQRGDEVTLVSFGGLPSSSQRVWCETTTRSFGRAFRFESSSTPLEWMQNNQHACDDASLLVQLAREQQSDVLLSSQFCFGALPLRCPKIVVAHSDVLSWVQACRESPLPSTAWLDTYRSLVADGLAGADAVIAPTRSMLSALVKYFRLPQNVHIIPNGRTLHALHSPKTHRAITAGRLWDEAKNLSLLHHVSSPFPILVAGEGAPGQAVFPHNVTIIGPQPEDDLIALFRESSVYICTSRYEPFGLAPLEAALCGCAVLANDIPSLREVWEDSALYFHDAASLSSLLSRLHHAPAQLQAAQQRSLKRAQLFTTAKMTDAYQAVFGDLLSQYERREHAA